MTISLSEFLAQLAANPVLAVTVALTLGVVLVNGWTDAPNAIATCVSTRAMSARSAILMAAVFNFLGVLVMTMVNASVAATIYNMVDFGGNTADALTALCAALVAIVAWATAAWWFGIPTSESHALIAGLSGAAIAPARRLCGHQRRRMDQGPVRPGSVYSAGLRIRLGRGQAGGVPVQKHGPAAHHGLFRRRTDRGRRGYGVHARRTGRPKSLWAFSCWASFWPTGRTTSPLSDPAVADGIVQCRNGSGHFHRRLPHHQGCGHGYGEAGKIPGALPPTWRARPACCFPR